MQKVINILCRNKSKFRYIICRTKNTTIDMLITADYFRLNEILKQMVEANQLTNGEREELLHKSGLIKQEDGTWKELPQDARQGEFPTYLTLD